MLKMKYYKTILFVLLYLKYQVGVCESKEPLIELIEESEIYVNGHFASLKTLMENDSLNKTVELFVPANPNIVYSALKCEYAHIVVDILKSFYEYFMYEVKKTVDNDEPDMGVLWQKWQDTNPSETSNLSPSRLLRMMDLFSSFRSNLVLRMIYNLFELSDRIQELRTNDPSLLKAMIAINLFFYHYEDLESYAVEKENNVDSSKDENVNSSTKTSSDDDENVSDNESTTNSSDDLSYKYTVTDSYANKIDYHKTLRNVVVLNNSIVNMIGLVDRFRYRKCKIKELQTHKKIQQLFKTAETNDYNKLTENFYDTISNVLDKNENLSFMGTVNYELYTDEFYNPDYIVMKHLLEYQKDYIGNTTVIYKSKSILLAELYTNLLSTYNIDDIFDLQRILFEVITDMFYRQMHTSLSKKPENGTEIFIRNTLWQKFNFFMNEITPFVCLGNACNTATAIKLSFVRFQTEYEKTKDDSLLPAITKEFESIINNQFIYTKNENYDTTLYGLVDKIMDPSMFKAFKQVFKLLSYESYTNDQYYIAKISDLENKKSGSDHDQVALFGNMNELRYMLCAFSIFSNKNNETLSSTIDENQLKIPEKFVSTEFGTLFVYISIYIAKTFKVLSDRKDFQNILIPLLVHMEYTNQTYPEMTDFDYRSLYQTLLITITMIENALLLQYKWLPYNNFIYRYRVLKNKDIPDLNDLRQVLREKAISSLKDITYESTTNLMSDEYNIYVHKSLFQEKDTEFRVYWNGTLQSGYEIQMDVSKGVIYVNDLISYQDFIIKWFVAKIMLGIKHFLILSRTQLDTNPSQTEDKNKMKTYVLDFDNLEFPISVENLLADTVKAIKDIMNPESKRLDDVSFEQIIQSIDKNLEALDVEPTNDVTNKSINDTIEHVSHNITQCSTFLKEISNKNQNALISHDLSLSPIDKKTTDEIIGLNDDESSESDEDDTSQNDDDDSKSDE